MSHFNKGAPTLYTNGQPFVLPEMDRSGREEDFPKESERFESLDGVLIEDILGYRLFARYKWGHLAETDINSMISAYNESEGLRLKFSGWPKSYPVIITEFKKGLRDGLKYEDSLEITFEGVELVSKYPDMDLLYTCWQNVHGPALCILNPNLFGLDEDYGDFDSGAYGASGPGVSTTGVDTFVATISDTGIFTLWDPIEIGSIYRLVWEGTAGVSIYTHDGGTRQTLIGTGEGNHEFTADATKIEIASDSIQTVTKVALVLHKIGEA